MTVEISKEPTILFQDQEIIVLNKPAGLTVNKADTTRYELTVQEWIEANHPLMVAPQAGEEDHDFFKRTGIVHRLDKETSGVLVIARTKHAFEQLQKQFKERVVKKTYWALCHDAVAPVEGEITVPIGRLPWNRHRFGVLAGGREAKTKYKVLHVRKYHFAKRVLILSLLELYPQTGRTHQIRVHCKYIHHPIFGDLLYAGRKTARFDRQILPRIFLHATKISFIHPGTRKILTFEAPLPRELESILQQGE